MKGLAMPNDFQEHVDEPTFSKILAACKKRGVRVTVTVRDGASITCRTEMSGNAGSIDFDLWRRVRPLDIEAVEGFENESAATVIVRGRDPDGRPRRWAYHLVRRPADADWRILYEWELD